jgi:hypothetical protein
MAIGTPVLHANTGATATNVTSASFTPNANETLFAAGSSRASSGVPPVITDSLGSTWTLVPSSNVDNGNANFSLYYLVVGGSPSSMTVTATSTGATQVGLGVIGIAGGSTDFSNWAVDTDTAGDPSVTLAAITSGSAILGWHMQNAGAAPSANPSGYTSLYNGTPATNIRHSCWYDLSSPGTTLSWTSTGTDCVAFAIEIKEASSTSPITGSTTVTFGEAASLKGAGRLAGSTLPAFSLAGTLSATIPITGTSAMTFTPTAAITALVPITGATSFAFDVTGSGNAFGALTGTSDMVFTESATLLGNGRPFGSSFPVFTVEGTLSGLWSMTGTCALAFTTAGTVTGNSTITGTSALTFTTAGTLAIPSGLFGGVLVTFTPTGTLRGSGSLTGTSGFVFTTAASGSSVNFMTGVSTCSFETSGSTYAIRSPYGFTSGTSSEIIYEVN